MIVNNADSWLMMVHKPPMTGNVFSTYKLMMTGDALWSLWTCLTLIHRCFSHKNVVVLVAEVHLHDCFHATGLRHAGSGMRETRASHDSAGALATGRCRLPVVLTCSKPRRTGQFHGHKWWYPREMGRFMGIFLGERMSMTSSRCADIGIMQPLVVINHG